MSEAVRLRFTADVFQAVGKAREVLGEMLKVERQVVSTSETIKATARANIEAAVQERKALKGVHDEYTLIAKNAKRGSEVQIEANRLAADSARQLAVAYKEAGSSALLAGRRARAGTAEGAAGREASGIRRGFEARVEGVGGALAGPGFVTGAIAGIVTVKAIEETLKMQESQKQLAQALKATGQSWADNRREINDYLESTMKATSFDKNDLRGTLTTLVRAFGNVKEAEDAESTAADVARGRHISLENASRILIRAHQGNVGALRRLGIEIPKVTKYEDELKDAHVKADTALRNRAKALDVAATSQKAMALLQERYANSSAAYTESLKGRMDALRNTLKEYAIELGTKLIPATTRFVTWLQKTIEQAHQSRTVHQLLHAAVKVLTEAFKDIGAVITHVVKPMFEWLAGALTHHRKLAIALGIALGVMFAPMIVAVPIAVGFIIRHWKTIRGFFANLLADIRDFFHNFWDHLKMLALQAVADIVEPFSHLPGRMGHWARKAKDSIHAEMSLVAADMQQIGKTAGETFGEAFKQAAAQGVGAAVEAAAKAGAGAAKSGSTTGIAATAPSGTAVQQGIVKTATAVMQGPYARYVYGGGGAAGPSDSAVRHDSFHFKGFDCSGFVQYVMAQNGIDVPRTSQAQAQGGVGVPLNQLAPGDLVFTEGWPHPGHVGIYIGDGKIIEDPHTGASIRVTTTSGFGVEGARRYYSTADKSSHVPKTTAPPKHAAAPAPPAEPAGAAGFHTAVEHAPKVVHHHKRIKKAAEASAAAIAGVQQTIDETLAQLHEHGLDKVAKNIEVGLRKLRAQLHKGMTPQDLAMLRVNLRPLEHAAGEAISKATAEAHKKQQAQAAAIKKHNSEIAKSIAKHNAEIAAQNQALLNKLHQQWQSAWSDFVKRVDREFDKVTQAHVQKMEREMRSDFRDLQEAWSKTMRDFDRETSRQLKELDRKQQQEMQQFDEETQRGLAGFNVAETPEEAALREFQQKRAAEQHQQTIDSLNAALAAAQQSGDPQQIADAQAAILQQSNDDQERLLQQSADDSRRIQDKKTTDDQDAYQKRRDDQKDALTTMQDDQKTLLSDARDDLKTHLGDEQQDREDAWTKARQDAIDAYTTMRDDAKTQMDDTLSAIEQGIQDHTDTWASVGKLLGKNLVDGIFGGMQDAGIDPSVLTDPYVTDPGTMSLANPDPSVAIKQLNPLLRRGRRLDVPGMATGGIVPGVDLGRDSVLRMLRPGERVETVDEVRSGVHGSAGGDTLVMHFHGHVWDKQELMDDIRSGMLSLGRRLGPPSGAPSARTGRIFGGRG